jgi:TolB-like protein/DNA-binding winged helix-turn-helix (wHTH) protein/Flp pilus assembly protein TadD
VENRVLAREGEPLVLTRKNIDSLIVLIEHRGEVLDKERFFQLLWPDVAVEESNLSQNIYLLRKALSENVEQPQIIETIPKKGYRFIAEVNECSVPEVITDTRTLGSEETAKEEDRQTATSVAPTNERPQSGASHASLNSDRRSSKRLGTIIIGGIFLSACVLFAVLAVSRRNHNPKTLHDVKSVAVLPFKLIGSSSNDTPMGLGMTDSLITKLSTLKQIKVLPTSAVFNYTDGNVNPIEIGRRLRVDAIMMGTVQKDGERIRVTVQMCDVTSGQFLWTEPFESEGNDIFRLQDAISERVVQALNFRLSEPGKELLTKRYTNNAQAYEAYITGMYFWNKRTADGLALSIKYFQEATQKDPQYALAFALLGDALGLTVRLGYSKSSKEDIYEQAKAAALKALALDESLPEAHTALGMIYKNYELDPDKAEKEYKRALDLNPYFAPAHSRYGLLLMHRGKFDEAYDHIRQAHELDPLSPSFTTNMGAILYYRRAYDKSAIYYKRTVELEPTDYMSLGALGEVYTMQGNYDEAIANLTRAVEAMKGKKGYYQLLGDLGDAYAKAGKKNEAENILRKLNEVQEEDEVEWPKIILYTSLGDFNQALKLLEIGARLKHPWVFNIPSILSLRFSARYDPLRTDPRFIALLQSCFTSPFCK